MTVANGLKASAKNQGDILVKVTNQPILFRNVYYVSSLQLNVMSCVRLDERGISTFIGRGQCSFHYRKERNRFLDLFLGMIKNGCTKYRLGSHSIIERKWVQLKATCHCERKIQRRGMYSTKGWYTRL